MKRRRYSSVEPVFGSLIHHYGLRRISMGSKAGAHKAMLLATMAYNLKEAAPAPAHLVLKPRLGPAQPTAAT